MVNKRNQPCSCGSGKRYKNCCGLVRRNTGNSANWITNKNYTFSAAEHFNKGQAAFRQNRLDEAAIHFRQAIKLQPDYLDALNLLGIIYQIQGNLDESVTCFRQLLKFKPDYAEAQYNLANVLDDLGRQDEAVSCYRKALVIKPDYVEAYYNLGIALQVQGKHEEAAASFRHALTLKPDYVEAYNNLGNAFVALGKFDEAIANFNQAITLKYDYGEAICNLGYLYYMLGKIDEAILCYKKAVDLNYQVELSGFFLAALTGEKINSPPPQYVTNLFDSYAERFDQSLIQKLGYQVPELLRQLLDSYRQHSQIFTNALDLGCGTGLSGIPFKSLVRKFMGIDLSQEMLSKAAAKGIYNSLHQADLIEFLTRSQDLFDLIIAADVLIYIGELEQLFEAIEKRLCPDGLLLFSTEHNEGSSNYVLQQSGRFTHSTAYIKKNADSHHLTVVRHELTTIRKEKGNWITGELYLMVNNK